MLRCYVADHLVEPRHIRKAESRQGAIVRYAQQDHAAFGVGKGRHLCRQRIRTLHILLELTAAVLTQRHLRLQFAQSYRANSDSSMYQCSTDAGLPWGFVAASRIICSTVLESVKLFIRFSEAVRPKFRITVRLWQQLFDLDN